MSNQTEFNNNHTPSGRKKRIEGFEKPSSEYLKDIPPTVPTDDAETAQKHADEINEMFEWKE